MAYKVRLDSFEGPLDLLVHLIESAKMDIYNIEIRKITNQYIDYVKKMQEMNIDVASEFIFLAATLLNIKSKYLLPQNSQIDEEENLEDPRSQLVAMILEYKKFKRAAKIFSECEAAGQCILEKPMEDLSHIINSPVEHLKLKEEDFISAFEKFLIKKKKLIEIKRRYDNIQRKRITAEERISYISEVLEKSSGDEVDFFDVVKNREDNYDIALSFTSVLELIKQKSVTARQDVLYGDIKLLKNCQSKNGEEI